MAMLPATEYRSLQRCQSLGLDATQRTPVNGPTCFCRDLCRSGATRSHPKIRKLSIRSWAFVCLANVKTLTSKLAKQYQQNTCLQRLHIIWAQPSSFSIGTAHMGQHLIRSLSNIIIDSLPFAANRLVFSSQDCVACHWKFKKIVSAAKPSKNFQHLRVSYSPSKSLQDKSDSALHEAAAALTTTTAAAKSETACHSTDPPSKSSRSPPSDTTYGTCRVQPLQTQIVFKMWQLHENASRLLTSVQSIPMMFGHETGRCEQRNFRYGNHTLRRTHGIRTRHFIGALGDFKLNVCPHALEIEEIGLATVTRVDCAAV